MQQPRSRTRVNHDCHQLVGTCSTQSFIAAANKLALKHQMLAHESFFRLVVECGSVGSCSGSRSKSFIDFFHLRQHQNCSTIKQSSVLCKHEAGNFRTKKRVLTVCSSCGRKTTSVGGQQEKEMQFGCDEKAVDETRTHKLNFDGKDTIFMRPLFASAVDTSAVQVSHLRSRWNGSPGTTKPHHCHGHNDESIQLHLFHTTD